MNVSFKVEIVPSQYLHLLQLVMVVPSSQPWMKKEIIEGRLVPIDSVMRGCVNEGCANHSGGYANP